MTEFQKIEPPKGYRVVEGSITIENGHIHYLIEPIEERLPDTPEEAFEILGCDYYKVTMLTTSKERAEALTALADLLTLWDCWGDKEGPYSILIPHGIVLYFASKNNRDQFRERFIGLINTVKNIK